MNPAQILFRLYVGEDQAPVVVTIADLEALSTILAAVSYHEKYARVNDEYSLGELRLTRLQE